VGSGEWSASRRPGRYGEVRTLDPTGLYAVVQNEPRPDSTQLPLLATEDLGVALQLGVASRGHLDVVRVDTRPLAVVTPANCLSTVWAEMQSVPQGVGSQ
jgi:hypothetical protein